MTIHKGDATVEQSPRVVNQPRYQPLPPARSIAVVCALDADDHDGSNAGAFTGLIPSCLWARRH
ncbi:hypothetical protein MOKP106_42540 [Mycobacterium avium subsp. hominissuis]